MDWCVRSSRSRMSSATRHSLSERRLAIAAAAAAPYPPSCCTTASTNALRQCVVHRHPTPVSMTTSLAGGERVRACCWQHPHSSSL